jgi:hypothetical protein
MAALLVVSLIIPVSWYVAEEAYESELANPDVGAAPTEFDGVRCPDVDPCAVPTRCFEYESCFFGPRARCYSPCATDEECGSRYFCNGHRETQGHSPRGACLRR